MLDGQGQDQRLAEELVLVVEAAHLMEQVPLLKLVGLFAAVLGGDPVGVREARDGRRRGVDPDAVLDEELADLVLGELCDDPKKRYPEVSL